MNPSASRYRSSSIIGAYPHDVYGMPSVGCLASAKKVSTAATVLLDGDLVMGREYRSHQRFQVGVVTLVVLGDGIAQPLQVAGVGGLVRLLSAQRRVRLGLLLESPEQKVELDVHRLLAPQRAVVVEHRDTLPRLNVIRPAFGADPAHEVDDRRPRRPVGPGASSATLIRPGGQEVPQLLDRGLMVNDAGP